MSRYIDLGASVSVDVAAALVRPIKLARSAINSTGGDIIIPPEYSAKIYEHVKLNYENNQWTSEMLQKLVEKGFLTKEQYENITQISQK